MPSTRKSIGSSSSKAKTPEQTSREDRLARSRQKAREWAEQQKHKSASKAGKSVSSSASKVSKTPTGASSRRVPATTSKIPSKAFLRTTESTRRPASRANTRSNDNKTPDTNKSESEDEELLDEEEAKLLLSKKEILANARRKSRSWADSQLSNTPTPAKKSPRVQQSKSEAEEFLDEEEAKLLLSKKEILANARRKSRSWAESRLSNTPTRAKKSRRLLNAPTPAKNTPTPTKKSPRVHGRKTGPTGTPEVASRYDNRMETDEDEDEDEEEDDKVKVEEMDESEEEGDIREPWYTPMIDKKERIQKSREKAKQWAEAQKSQKRQHGSGRKTSTPSSAGRAKRRKPSASPQEERLAEQEELFFMSPDSDRPMMEQQPQIPRVEDVSLPVFPTSISTPLPADFYDPGEFNVQQPAVEGGSRLIRTPFRNMLNRSSRADQPATNNIQSVALDTNSNLPTERLESMFGQNQSHQRTNNNQPAAYQPTASAAVQNVPNRFSSSKTVKIDESQNVAQLPPAIIHSMMDEFEEFEVPKHSTTRFSSFITYFNIFDSFLGFFLKAVLSLILFAFIHYCWSMSLHPMDSSLQGADENTSIILPRYVPPCFHPSPGKDFLLRAPSHRSCDENRTEYCPSHGTCSAGFLLECAHPFVTNDLFDACEPSTEALAELEQLLKNFTADAICTSTRFVTFDADAPPLFTLPSEYGQLYPYLDQTKFLVQNNTISFSSSYIESGKVPISMPCTLKFLFFNLSLFFFRLIWLFLSKLFLLFIEYPLPSLILTLASYTINWIMRRKQTRKKEKAILNQIQNLVYDKLQQGPANGIQANHLRDAIAFDLYASSLKERKKMSITIWPKVASNVKYDTRIKRVNRGRSEYWEWDAPKMNEDSKKRN